MKLKTKTKTKTFSLYSRQQKDVNKGYKYGLKPVINMVKGQKEVKKLIDPNGDLPDIIEKVVLRRLENDLKTVFSPAKVGDIDNITELAKHVGEAGEDFTQVLSSLIHGKNPGRAGYSFRLITMRSSEEGSVEGYNLVRVRDTSYPFETQLGLSEKVAGSLSTSFGGSASGGGTIILNKALKDLEAEGVSKVWCRPNKKMEKAFARHGFQETKLPKIFIDKEKEGGRSIYAVNMSPKEVAYEYFRGLIVGDIGYRMLQGMQMEYRDGTDQLDDWIKVRGLHISKKDAEKWLTHKVEKQYGQKPAQINATTQHCEGVSMAAYADAIQSRSERQLRWVMKGTTDSMEYHPAVDLAFFAAHYLTKGEEFRRQTKQGEEPKRIYDFLKKDFFNGNEF